jgi:Cu+-exporting ATPase
MFRRRFLQLVTMASAAGLTPLEAAITKAATAVTYRVKGFSCITCATGLDAMLREQKGILSSKATYSEGRVTVSFDRDKTSEQAIVAFIAGLGFTVTKEMQAPAAGRN